MRLTRLNEKFNKPLYRLDVSSTLRFANTPSGEVVIYIPEEFSILKQKELFNSTDVIPGFSAVRYRVSNRKYRDVSGGISLFIYASREIKVEKPFITLLKRDGKRFYKNTPYRLESEKSGTIRIKKVAAAGTAD